MTDNDLLERVEALEGAKRRRPSMAETWPLRPMVESERSKQLRLAWERRQVLVQALLAEPAEKAQSNR